MWFVGLLLLFFMVLAGLASLALWTVALIRLLMGQPLLDPEPRRLPAGGVLGIVELGAGLVYLVVAIVLTIVLPLAAFTILQRTTTLLPSLSIEELPPSGRAAFVLISSLSTAVAMLVTAVLAIIVNIALPSSFGDSIWRKLAFSLKKLPYDLLIGGAAFLMLAPAVYLIMLVLTQWFKSEHPLIKIVKDQPDVWFFTLCSFSAVIVAPIVEEFLFRVLLQGWLEKLAVLVKQQPAASPAVLPPDQSTPLVLANDASDLVRDFSNPYAPPSFAASQEAASSSSEPLGSHASDQPPPFWPVLVSSAIFALLHWSHGPDPIPLFVLAVGLGYLYRQTHRVLPGIVVHMLLNGVSMLMLLVSIYGGTPL